MIPAGLAISLILLLLAELRANARPPSPAPPPISTDPAWRAELEAFFQDLERSS